MVTILIMLAKLASLGLLEIKLFRNKGHDVIVSLSPRSNYIVDHVVVMLPKFGNSGLARGEVIINSNL